MKKILLFTMIAAIPSWAQTDLVFPWVTNTELFRGNVIINNLNSSQVEITLTATRPVNTTQPQSETITLMLDPMEQVVKSAADLFVTLGDGKAFMIQLTSSSDNILGGFINNGTQSVSGVSPSQANVMNMSDAGNTLFFNYLTITDPSEGYSAAVVINAGDIDSDVSFYTYQDGILVGDPVVINIQAKTPYDSLAAGLAPPNTAGTIMIVAHSDDVPLLGTVFIFNAQLEPSMANAVTISGVPQSQAQTSSLTYYADIEPIIAANCGTGNCHLGGSNKGGLNLDHTDGSNDPYINLLGESTYEGLNLIQPNDTSNSYLYRKVQEFSASNDYFGNQMPPSGRDPLSTTQINTLREWILDGAAEGTRPN